VRELQAKGLGEITQPREWPPRRTPWVLDNGAFAASRAGGPFDETAWLAVLKSAKGSPPDFAIAPDVVGKGFDSVAFSCLWLARCEVLDVPWYLALQDGVEHDERTVRAAVMGYGFDGVFVGGSLAWKLEHGARLVALAHEMGVRCHIGRVGTAKRVRWAMRIGADSIDSSVPLWSRENLTVFSAALEGRQGEMW
jgi:hypothetical protein